MPSRRATACSDCHQSTVPCAVLCAPFRAHLARQTRHHVTLSRPVRFRWQPVRPRRCSGPGQLPSHRPGGAAACRGRRQCTGDTGVLPSQGHVAVRTLWATAISTPGKWIYWPPSLPCTVDEGGVNSPPVVLVVVVVASFRPRFLAVSLRNGCSWQRSPRRVVEFFCQNGGRHPDGHADTKKSTTPLGIRSSIWSSRRPGCIFSPGQRPDLGLLYLILRSDSRWTRG